MPDLMHPMTPDEHREQGILNIARAEQPALTAEQMSAYAAIATAHALLALHTPPAPARRTSDAASVAVLALLCLTALAAVWMLR